MSSKEALQHTQLTAQQVVDDGGYFIEHFKIEADPTKDTPDFLAALEQLNPRFQGGRDLVRWELENDPTEWDEKTKGIVMDASKSYRMLEKETPLVGFYDLAVILGGARQSNLDRARFAAQAVSNGNAVVLNMIVGGSNRELNESEQTNVANYALGAVDEYDLCAAAARSIGREYPGIVMSPLFVPEPKAGTPRIIERAIEAHTVRGKLPKNTGIAAVTTQIYQVSTGIDLSRVAKEKGVTVPTFTAGNPSDPEVMAKRTIATYLSENLRTLRAAANYLEFEQKQTNDLLEKTEAKVAQLVAEGSTVLNQSSDGAILVENDNGDRTMIEPDGRTWTQYSSISGLTYNGPDDLLGEYPE